MWIPLPSLALCLIPSDLHLPALQGNQELARLTAECRADIEALAACGTRHTLSSTSDPRRGIGAARRWLEQRLQAISARDHGGRLRVVVDEHEIAPGRRLPEGVRLANVMGILPGRDPDRWVVVSGHYDSICSDVMDARSDAPGANDDASGVAVVLACARLLAGLEPRATLVFMAVSGEEQGLYGSTAQAAKWKAAGIQVEAFLTNDIVGGVLGDQAERHPRRVRLFSEGRASAGQVAIGSDNDSPSRQLARYLLGEQGDTPDFRIELVFRQDRFLRGGDHKPFNLQGWAAVRFTEAVEDYDHQHQDVRTENGRRYGDLPEFVDFEYVALVARVNASGLRRLALAPRPPEEVKLDNSKLSPHTRLTWKRASPTEVAAYRVRLRRTSEPTWTRTEEAGPGNELVLRDTSIDDWCFAVEAVDAAGNVSLPVYPDPVRP